MSSIEDKILDGPRVHYCEAGDDDIREPDSRGNESITKLIRPVDDETEGQCSRRGGTITHQPSTNTGPKGVLEDHKNRDLEAEFDELLRDDSIIKDFVSKRFSEIPEFGAVQHLESGDEFLKAIDQERPNVLVVVHIYGRRSKSCLRLNECLNELAKDLKQVKFVTLDVGVTNLSQEFKTNGIPALQAYKSGKLLKSLIKLDDNLDQNFETAQLKEFLFDNFFS